MMVEGKTMAAELTAQSKGQLQIFSYWKSGASMSVSGSVLQKSLGNLTISPSDHKETKESNEEAKPGNKSCRRNIFEYITSKPSQVLLPEVVGESDKADEVNEETEPSVLPVQRESVQIKVRETNETGDNNECVLKVAGDDDDDDNTSDCEIVEVKVDSEEKAVLIRTSPTPPIPQPSPSSISTSPSNSGSSRTSGGSGGSCTKRVVRNALVQNATTTTPVVAVVGCELTNPKSLGSEGHTGENESRENCQEEDRNGNEGEYVNENDTGVQIDYDSHHSQAVSKSRSAGCQAKEKKSTPVAQFGTIYQPAGPLIEPHKTPECMPSGLETVKLPPDLKVTYQTHPPSSNPPVVSAPHSSNYSPTKPPSKKVSSSSSSTSTSSHPHHPSQSRSEKSSSSRILHQPYKSSASTSSSSVGTGTSHHSSSPQQPQPHHQQSSSSSSASSSTSLPRPVKANYPGTSYVVSGANTGSPLLSNSSVAAAMLSQQQQSAAAALLQQQHQQLASSALSGLGGHHHPIGSPVGPSHQPPPSASAGAPSAGGLFYSTSAGFAPHHSPFAPCKYPMVPPDSYRTHSPYPNSFLYPSATPQPSGQSYFMTPFYTPPLTPNAAPTVVTGGLGGGMGVGANQPRPLSLAHHPSVAAASMYHPQGGPPPPPSAHHHPSNYLVASPHHSIQPSPTAPGHAGLFHPNQSTQPACPCPTESYPLSSTNSNSKQQLQPQSVSSVSLPGLEVGVNAKHPKSQSQQALVSVTATRPSRHSTKDVPPHHPPTCTTPAVAADPPVTIQLLNSNVNVKQTQDRQLESAKTFTEQYSLPDDITITPIIVSNPNTNSALLLINSSISIVTTSAPSSLNNSGNSGVGNSGSNSSSPSKSPTKKKEKDIVHLIDPRSGHKTTIAKHISTKNLLASSTNGSPTKSRSKSPPKERNIPGQTSGSASAVSRLKSNINKIGSIKVGKLNPDLDVIVINNRASGSNADGGDVSGGSDLDHISQNGKLIHERMQNQKQQQQRSHNSKGGVRTQGKVGLDHHHHRNQQSDKDLQSGPMPNSSNLSNQQVMQHQNKPVPKGNRGQMLPRRIALVGSDNNSQHKLVSKKGNSGGKSPEKSLSSSNPPFSYSLPPGISISAGVGANLSITPAALHNNSQNVSVRPMTVQNYQSKCDSKSLSPGMQQVLNNQNSSSLSKKGPNGSNKKRISLNECIDGLQKKRMKLLEDHNMLGGNGSSEVMRGGSRVPGVLSTTTTPNGRLNSGIVFPINKANLARSRMHDAGATSARVRDPEGFSMGSTVIKSSDAIVAVSALVVDPASYHAGRNARAAAAMTAAVRGHNKNGLKRANGNKLQQQSRKNLVQSSVHGKKVGSSSSSGVGSLKVKLKGLEKVNGGGGARSTRSSAANAKIRTRLSTKPKLSGEGSSGVNSRSRSRLLRQRNQIISAGNTRKSESDCSSTNTSRSSSAVRLAGGNGPSGGKVERGNKYSTQAYINAVADLYQYRRNVMLRVPKAGVGIFPSASSVKLLNIPGNSSSSCGGRSASISPGQQGVEKKIGGSSQQLSPGNSQNVLSPQLAIGGSSSRSNSPSLPSTNMGTSTSKGPVGSMAASAAKKRAGVKPLSPSAVNGALLQLGVPRRQPKWSNGWRFEGEPYEAKVLVNNDDQPVLRVCYPAMRHESGDVIQTRDCVLLKSGSRKNDLPYIAKIAALWENPSDGEMMFSLLWYYRPEHTEMGRTKDDMMDEVFASKHIDVNSVATIDDRCYVLTFNEYCRYRKRLKQLEDGLPNKPLLTITGSSMINNNAAGNIACAVWSGRASSEDPTRAPSPGKISPEVVFFCRKVYDFRQKRIMKNPS